MELGRKGLNVVMIARPSDKLTAAAAEVEAATKVTVRTIGFDFSVDGGHESYAKLRAELAEYDVGVLVNNVGVSYPSALFFDEWETYDAGGALKMINVNVTAVTKMTQFVLPIMLKRAGRNKGVIINVASAAGRIPTGNPLYAEYSASKVRCVCLLACE